MSVSAAVAGRADERLADLYYRNADGARRLAYLLTGDSEVAEDITQEAFVKLVGRFHDIRHPDAFASYLRTTVVNLTRGYFRHLRIERNYLASERASTTDHECFPDVEERDEMWQRLQRLSPRQRAAIVLRYYEDLSEQQTADTLGCSVGAVKSLVNRGMEALRGHLRSEAQ
ncbi:MAG: RNA polymerase sigma factor [Actinomycetota bacterium]